MRVSIGLLVIFFAVIFTASCTSNRTSLPVITGYSAVKSAAQQDIVSQAVDIAVAKIDFTKFGGNSAYCEINGVFPHTDFQLRKYITARVEAKLFEQSVRILYRGKKEADYKCVISVASAGADILEVRENYSSKRIAANVFLQFPTLFTSWIWYPVIITDRYYVGKAKLHIDMIPLKAGLLPAFQSVTGSTKVHFAGEEEGYYPLIEGTAFETSINKEKKIDVSVGE